MRRACALALCLLLTLPALSGCGQRAVLLEGAAALSPEALEAALHGLDRRALLDAWGAPYGTLYGM